MRAYRWLLFLYPASFRAEYGGELCAAFSRSRRDCSSRADVLALWLSAAVDVLKNASLVHWDIFRQDVRHTARALRRTPWFTITALLLAALGTGATTAAFSVADHVLIRPIRFSDPDRLVKLWQDQSFRGYPRMELSPGNYRDWARGSTAFETMSAYTARASNLVGSGEPARLDGVVATGTFFEVLRVQAAHGRVFGAADDRESAPRTVVLSDSLWRARFNADPGVIGRKILLDGDPHVVIGVMPPGFDFPNRQAAFWAPIRFRPASFEDRSDTYLSVIARLKPDATIEQARSELSGIAARLARAYPKENERTGATVVRLRDEIGWRTRLLLIALVGASACLLLVACSNLATLLLARASARQDEIAIRAAIGGGRQRLVRQMLTESLLIAAAGGAIGGGLAFLAVPVISGLVPSTLPVAEVPTVDLRALVLAIAITTLTGLVFGLVPALRTHRQADVGTLRGGPRATSTRSTQRLRAVLVIAQIAATIVLLLASGLLMRALWRVQGIHPGFETSGVLTLRTSLPLPKYESTGRRNQFYAQVVDEIRALPGVVDAAYITALPMVWRGGIWPVTMGPVGPEGAGEAHTASLRFVTPGFFAAMGTPVRRGRDVRWSDTRDRAMVAVVSESLTRQLWPGENPLGRQFFIAFEMRTVVGVVGDIRVRGLERISEPQVYVPSHQVPDGALIGYTPKDLVVKAAAPGSLVPAIRQIIARADPEQPVSDIRPLADIITAETEERAVQVRMVGLFAIMSFVLAAVGIHGLLAFSIASRTREIGVRVALGATPRHVLRMVFGGALGLAAGGVLLGLVCGYAAARSLSAILAGVGTDDAVTLIAVLMLAIAMTLIGSLAPALRAARLDPSLAIRHE